jgi:UDP:flavonoid glycosyltransferase YjiC (YdhE family)
MSHILMVGATASSHVLPGVALMRELVRRGHRAGPSTASC